MAFQGVRSLLSRASARGMATRTPIVGGNWKCNPASISQLDELVANINMCDTSKCEVFVCPSPLHVGLVYDKFTGGAKVCTYLRLCSCRPLCYYHTDVHLPSYCRASTLILLCSPYCSDLLCFVGAQKWRSRLILRSYFAPRSVSALKFPDPIPVSILVSVFAPLRLRVSLSLSLSLSLSVCI